MSANMNYRRFASRASLLVGVAGLAGAMMTSSAQAEVTIRISSDTGGPPHPAAIAMEIFKEKVEEAIPGAEVRTFYSSALYNIPESVEAMTEGNLEMAWGQFGKTAQVDPYMSVVVGPMLLTTVGAVNELDNFETMQMLKDRFDEVHDVKMFGTSHMSAYMGAGSGSRLISPADFAGKKIRSQGPVENTMLESWGANPTTMAFGDVPPALETGVIDGLLTSLGGWNQIKEQAPFFSIAGINGLSGDYYYVAASNEWWNSMEPEHQQIIEKILTEELLPLAKQINYCNDKQLLDQYGTEDPSKPGIYILSDEEKQVLAERLGSATSEWIKSNTPSEADEWVEKFKEEAEAAVQANAAGTNWLENTDCEEIAPYFAKYTKQ